ncbi:MAG: response regulator, partial [Alphaproteobacteria bacterium]
MLLEGRAVTIVEDDPIMGESLVQSLSLEGCEVHWCESGADAISWLSEQSPDLVVCDIRL